MQREQGPAASQAPPPQLSPMLQGGSSETSEKDAESTFSSSAAGTQMLSALSYVARTEISDMSVAVQEAPSNDADPREAATLAQLRSQAGVRDQLLAAAREEGITLKTIRKVATDAEVSRAAVELELARLYDHGQIIYDGFKYTIPTDYP